MTSQKKEEAIAALASYLRFCLYNTSCSSFPLVTCQMPVDPRVPKLTKDSPYDMALVQAAHICSACELPVNVQSIFKIYTF